MHGRHTPHNKGGFKIQKWHSFLATTWPTCKSMPDFLFMRNAVRMRTQLHPYCSAVDYTHLRHLQLDHYRLHSHPSLLILSQPSVIHLLTNLPLLSPHSLFSSLCCLSYTTIWSRHVRLCWARNFLFLPQHTFLNSHFPLSLSTHVLQALLLLAMFDSKLKTSNSL